MANYKSTCLTIVAVALGSVVAAPANAETYRTLKCEYRTQGDKGDTVHRIRLTNIGNRSVPAKAVYTVFGPSPGPYKPKPKITLRPGKTLEPKQEIFNIVGVNWGASATCSASAFWVPQPGEVR